jgi:hypothetical protein
VIAPVTSQHTRGRIISQGALSPQRVPRHRSNDNLGESDHLITIWGFILINQPVNQSFFHPGLTLMMKYDENQIGGSIISELDKGSITATFCDH